MQYIHDTANGTTELEQGIFTSTESSDKNEQTTTFLLLPEYLTVTNTLYV